MAVPKKRTSKMRRRARWATSQKMAPLHLARCSHCNTAIPPHRVCHNCGHYAGKVVVELEGF